MAAKKTLNAKNLQALGAETLADLVMELVQGDAVAKRMVRAKLAGAAGPEDLAAEIRKRLATIKKAKGVLSWKKVHSLAEDLAIQLKLIVQDLIPKNPKLGAELYVTFLRLAPSIWDRAYDDIGPIEDLFDVAMEGMGDIIENAQMPPSEVAQLIYELQNQHDYAGVQGLVEDNKLALKDEGLVLLRQMYERDQLALTEEKKKQPTPKNAYRRDQQAVAHRFRQGKINHYLGEIADATGDVDAFMQVKKGELKRDARVLFEVAERLIEADRSQEAVALMEDSKIAKSQRERFGWTHVYTQALEASGRLKKAQTLRKKVFLETLEVRLLKTYLKHFPDFDDEEEENAILDLVMGHGHFMRALHFFLNWPDMKRAGDLVVENAHRLDGDFYEFYSPAARQIEAANPLAATLILRAMIDFAFQNRREKRYKHTAKHLQTCRDLVGEIQDFGSFESHESYESGLRERFGGRSAFWSLLPQ